MATRPVFHQMMASAVAIANRAGNVIRDILKSGSLGIVEKTGAQDLQTEADRTAQRCIVASLRQKFPKMTVIGEEDDNVESSDVDEKLLEYGQDEGVINCKFPSDLQSIKEEDVVIWVDPLDGTKEYTQGLLDHVTVLIGLAVDGKPVGGVIHQPYFNYKQKDDKNMGRTVWGIVGLGMVGMEKKSTPESRRIITTTRSHPTQLVNDCITAMKPDDVIRVGGAGHKVMLLLEGRADAYVFASKGCKKWDTCAPEAILRAVGGNLTDIHGNEIQYHASVKHPNTGGVLASCTNHDWYLNCIPESLKQQLPA